MPTMATKRRKPRAERKEMRLHVRLNKQQKDEIEAAARRDELDVSSWIRRAALAAARTAGGASVSSTAGSR